MVGAYLIASITAATGNYWWGLLFGVMGAAAFGALLELTILRRFYQRDHLSQVLGTFAILLICNEGVRLIWGSQPVALSTPDSLSGPVEIFSGFYYASFSLFIIGVGLLVALLMYWVITRTRLGMQVRAGAANREMAMAMGVDVLSMNASNLLKVKAAIRQVNISFVRRLLNEVLAMDNGEVIASYVDLQLTKAGLGDLLRNRKVLS